MGSNIPRITNRWSSEAAASGQNGFCLDNHEFAMPSCLLSLERGRDALK